MRHFTTLYTNLENLKNFLSDNRLDTDLPWVARVVTSQLCREECVYLAKNMKNILPNSHIIGLTSSVGVIYNSNIHEMQTLISLEHYDTLTLNRNYFTHKEKSFKDLAQEIYEANKHCASKNTAVNIFINSGFPYISELLEELNQYTPPLHLVGAVVGIIPNDDEGFLFDEQGIYDDNITTFSFLGESERHFITTNVSYEVLDEQLHEITAIQHDLIQEVDGIPANEWLFDYIGNKNHDFPLSDDLLTHFPIVLEDSSSSRFLHYEATGKKVSIHHETSLPLGTKFRKGCISPNFTLKNTHTSLLTMLDTPIESIFLCACFFRKIYLSNCIEWELKPFNSIPICGMFAMGEIVFREGRNQLHHGASVFIGVAEQEKYIVPDMDELLNTNLIDDAIDHLTNLIQHATAKKPEDFNLILSPIKKYDSQQLHDYFFDAHLHMPNMIQYKKDRLSYAFDKICVIEVESADAIIAFMGAEVYYTLFSEISENMLYALPEDALPHMFHYCFNYKTVFFTGSELISDHDFVEICSKIHKKFGRVTTEDSDATFHLRFVLAFHSQRLVEDGIKYLFENRNNPETFLVCKGDDTLKNPDLPMVNIIKWAIENKKVIPYYQGLYHNSLKKINRYESLMRIEDAEGTIYTPDRFLWIAKKYNLYQKISFMMLEQVLEDFKDRNEPVSINISILDIQSDTFRNWFLTSLRQYPSPENITVEIVESDHFYSNTLFFAFLKELKACRCHLAVDDFGTRASSFLTISEIQPDYIKIDSSITKNIATDEKSLALFDTIAYFAKKINALTVAEFVENETIQGALTPFAITYSQGYFFCKPVPLQELGE